MKENTQLSLLLSSLIFISTFFSVSIILYYTFILHWTLLSLLCEIFHAWCHSYVLLYIRPIDFETIRESFFYFIFDMTSPLCTCLLLTNIPMWFYFLLSVHSTLHLFYVSTWYDGYYSKRIQMWSARQNEKSRWTMDLVLTLYDIFIHSFVCYSLLYSLGIFD